GIGGIAPDATEWAAGQSYEGTGEPGPGGLALDRMEDLRDPERVSHRDRPRIALRRRWLPRASPALRTRSGAPGTRVPRPRSPPAPPWASRRGRSRRHPSRPIAERRDTPNKGRGDRT